MTTGTTYSTTNTTRITSLLLQRILLTLTEANLVVYYANDFNLETRIQSEDRAHRIGQKNNVTYIDLISEGTIDERIVKALRSKIDIGALVLGEEAKQWLKLNPTRK